MRPRIQDKFTNATESKVIRKMMRWKNDSLCIVCGKPSVNANHCEFHRLLKNLAWHRWNNKH